MHNHEQEHFAYWLFVAKEDPYTEMDNAAYKQAVNSARKMKVKGYALEDIIDITGLSIEEIEAL